MRILISLRIMEYPEWEGTHKDHPSPTPALHRHPTIPSCAVPMFLELWQVLGAPKALKARGEATPGQSRVGQSPPWTSSISTPHSNAGGCRKCRATTRNSHEAPIPSLCQQSSVVGSHFHIIWMGRDTGIVFPQDTKVLPPTQAWT